MSETRRGEMPRWHAVKDGSVWEVQWDGVGFVTVWGSGEPELDRGKALAERIARLLREDDMRLQERFEAIIWEEPPQEEETPTPRWGWSRDTGAGGGHG